jgi:hypothetical protein
MKLVLRGFSQDIDLRHLEAAENYLVFEDERTHDIYRLPVPMETVTRLTEITLAEGPLTPEEPPSSRYEEGDEEPEEEELAPTPVTPPTRRPVQQPSRTVPVSEEDVPSV